MALLCKGCKSWMQLWLGEEALEESDRDQEAEQKLRGEADAASTASGEADDAEAVKDEGDAAPPAGRGAKLVLKHRHRSECRHSEGNRFITNAQL